MSPATGMLRRVKKSQDNNVYMYIDRPLGDPLIGACMEEMEVCLSRIFYENERALACTLSALSLAFVGENVGRAFWTISRGAISPSLFTSLLENAFTPNHGFLNFDALRCDDDELRKCVVAMSPKCVVKSKDSDANGFSDLKNVRVELYKKLCDGDSMLSRLPHSIAAKRISTRGLLRFDPHRPLSFSEVNEINCDAIYRRSLVIELRAGSPPRSEMREGNGSAHHVSGMKDFLSSMSASSVFIRHLISHMEKYTVGESTSMIERYAQEPGGVTWRTVRSAFRLPPFSPAIY